MTRECRGWVQDILNVVAESFSDFDPVCMATALHRCAATALAHIRAVHLVPPMFRRPRSGTFGRHWIQLRLNMRYGHPCFRKCLPKVLACEERVQGVSVPMQAGSVGRECAGVRGGCRQCTLPPPHQHDRCAMPSRCLMPARRHLHACSRCFFQTWRRHSEPSAQSSLPRAAAAVVTCLAIRTQRRASWT